MVMVGASVDELEQLARVMRDSGQRLGSIKASLGAQISGTRWTGPDGARFCADWSASYVRMLTQVEGALEQLSVQLTTEARGQATASDSNGIGAGATTRSPAQSAEDHESSSGNILDKLNRLDERLKDTFGLNPFKLPWIISGGIELGYYLKHGEVFEYTSALGKAFSIVGTGIGVAETVSDTWAAYRTLQTEGVTSPEFWFDTMDAAGSGIGAFPHPVAMLGGIAIKNFADAGRLAVQIDWSDPLPPPTPQNLTEVYLPSLGGALKDTTKILLGNL